MAQLEDHVGDIIAKARFAADLSLQETAELCGTTEGELAALEEFGTMTAAPDWEKLGILLNLDSGRLKALAEGWTPAIVDLSQWRHLHPLTTQIEEFKVNCYLIWDEATRDAALFDTGMEAEPILKCIKENELHLTHLLITHTHHDHVAALDAIRSQFPKIRIRTHSRNASAGHRLKQNQFIHVGNLRVSYRETPGHAEDGVTYLVTHWPESAPPVAIVGDALFAGSIGKGFQSTRLAKQKVREQILSLPPATLICPGHGPLTTVAEETQHNPWFPPTQ